MPRSTGRCESGVVLFSRPGDAESPFQPANPRLGQMGLPWKGQIGPPYASGHPGAGMGRAGLWAATPWDPREPAPFLG